jgi:hypothetical protein
LHAAIQAHRPLRIWQIFPFPLADGLPNQRNFNSPERLQVLQGDRSFPDLRLFAALETIDLPSATADGILQVIRQGAGRTLLTTFPITNEQRRSARSIPGSRFAALLPMRMERGARKTWSRWLASEVRRYLGRTLSFDQADRYMAELLDPSAVPPPTSLSRRNVLQNPDFARGQTTGWRKEPAKSVGEIGSTPWPAGSDNWAATVHSDTRGYHGGMCQTISVQPMGTYLYFVQAAVELSPPSRAIIAYWDYGRFSQVYGDAGFAIPASASWSPYGRVVTVPIGVKSISLCPALLTDDGTIFFGKVWFLPLDAFR